MQYFNKLKLRLLKVSKNNWLLFAILIVGLFLRTYHFKDWMVFNPDQGRDALLIQDMLSGKAWPLLGPQAGNTMFKLGPIFYYLEFASAKLFGGSAQSMAFPDLLTSLLSLPLMYALARKLFKSKVALLVSALYAVSYFMVYYSRFAFNPNSIPFYTMLFLLGLIEILTSAKKEKHWWAAAVGLAMGIGVQLHALLLVTMPIVAVLALIWMFAKRNFVWKSALVVLAFFFLANTGQLISEIKSGGENTKAFFSGAGSESSGGKLGRNISYDLACHVQGITYVSASLGGGDKCTANKLINRIEKKGFKSKSNEIAIFVFGLIFLAGGLILMGKRIKKENDQKKKIALVLIVGYVAILFLVFIPVASGISIRYFIAEAVLPFVLFGLWLEFGFEQKNKYTRAVLVGLLIVLFFGSNLLNIANSALAYQKHAASTVDNGIYGEIKTMNDYLISNSEGSNKIYLAGKRSYLSRYAKPLEYFLAQEQLNLHKLRSDKEIKSGTPLFYITKKSAKKDSLPVVIPGHATIEIKNFGNIAIYKLQN